MSGQILPATASCRCGATHVTVSAPAVLTAACHCKGCQRMTASAYSVSAMYPVSGFEVTKGSPVLGGLKDADIQHYFCPECMSWMFTRMSIFPDVVNVRATLFDNLCWYAPFIETQTRDKQPWAEAGAAHLFHEFPSAEQIPALLAEFAEQLD